MLEVPDSLQRKELVIGIEAISRLLVDACRLKQPNFVVIAQRMAGQAEEMEISPMEKYSFMAEPLFVLIPEIRINIEYKVTKS